MSKDGGPAFPTPFAGHCGNESHADPCGCYMDSGMSLRDFFAAVAMNGILSREVGVPREAVAKLSYQYAENMLKEREKGE